MLYCISWNLSIGDSSIISDWTDQIDHRQSIIVSNSSFVLIIQLFVGLGIGWVLSDTNLLCIF